MTDAFYELMRCAPSTRRFTDEPVDPSALRRALDNARFAPSGGNRQGWRVIVVTDQGLRTRMRELYQQPWDEYMVETGGRAALDAAGGDEPPPGRIRMLRAPTSTRARSTGCRSIWSCASRSTRWPSPTRRSIAPAWSAARRSTRSSRTCCWRSATSSSGASFTTLIVPAEPALRELLAIPDGIAVAGHIAVGHRADRWPSKLRRNPVSAFTFGGALWRALGLTASATRGRCLCGAVVYELHGPLRDVLVCHCVECRRWGGHAAAMTAVPDERLVLVEDDGLRWIDSPDSAPHARRGFCGECGSSLFWDSPQRPQDSVAAGTLDGDTGVVADAGTSGCRRPATTTSCPTTGSRVARAGPRDAARCA